MVPVLKSVVPGRVTDLVDFWTSLFRLADRSRMWNEFPCDWEGILCFSRVLETFKFFGFTEIWWFTQVIEGSLPRIGQSLLTLLSVS